MIKAFEDRSVQIGQRVEVYRNLNMKGNLFSIRDKKTKLVLAHGEGFIVSECAAKVNERSRQKVLQEKRRSVHAWVEGTYCGESNIDINNIIEIKYNPYKNDSFIRTDNEQKAVNSDLMYFKNGKAYIV